MKIEIRADGAHISGYVNATEKKSRPVITPHGKVIEVIEPRAFEQAIDRAGNISVTVDHDKTHVYASTEAGTLSLYEDSIGLHADTLITDPVVIELAKKGKIKGWSFGMYNVQDSLEPRADDLPLRKITALDLDHITLVVNKQPIYSATSVEIRATGEIDVEYRATNEPPKIIEEKIPPDNSEYKNRINALKAR
jgi:HK97 family phage prohead protease